MTVLWTTKTWAQQAEDWFLRVGIIIYLIIGHVCMLILWPSGLKVAMINADPWPYKRLFGGLLHGYDEQ